LTIIGKARLNSCVGNEDDASAWIEAMPYDETLTMSDIAVKSALRFRLGVEYPELPSEGILCPRRGCGKLVDSYAHHFVAGCQMGNQKQRHHESVVHVIKKLLQKAGRRVFISEAIQVTPKQKIKPDLDVYHSGKKDLLDITIVDRLLPFRNLNNSSEPRDTGTAESREREKISHYSTYGIVSDPRNGLVIPVAVEILGKVGKMGYDYLCKAADNYEKGYRRSTIKKYWFGKISVALQNAIGESVAIHLSEVISSGKIEGNEEHEQDQYILGSLEIGAKRTSCGRGVNALSKK
jgi:hypothetical protein